jgi:hypothetical protein
MQRLLSILLCLVALHSTAAALEFRALSWQGPLTDLHYLQNGRTTALTANERILSTVHTFTGTDTLILFREIERDGLTVRETVAELPVPANLVKAILILIPQGDAGTCTGLWIDDSADKSTGNQIRFINLSNHTAAIKSGGTSLLIPSRGEDILPFGADQRSVPLSVAAQTHKGWQLVSTQRQAVRDGYHIVVILRGGRDFTDDYGTHQAAAIELLALYEKPPVTKS